MKLRTITKANLENKRALVRVDYNVALDKDGTVLDDTRITQSLPTLNYLINNKSKIILISHLARPGGKVDSKYSLANVAEVLSKYIKRKVSLIDNYWEKEALEKISKIKSGEIYLLENIRFHKGETLNDKSLARHLSKMGDIFVNDAFGTAHRAHASVVGVSTYLPSYAGLLLEKEVTLITETLNKSNGKLVLVIGGAKTPEKIKVIDKLLEKADSVLLGGAVANTFLSTWNISTGCSLVDYEMIEMARQIIWKATQSNASLLMPEDVVVSNESKTRKPKTLSYKQVPGHLAIFDIGRETIKKYTRKINNADRVIWNGPMGLFEDPRFKRGTKAIFDSLVNHKGTTIIGGGDTLAMTTDKNKAKKITHISTGGGAMLEFLEKGTLPGLEIVRE
jgi:phosphoglycerate kinase